MNTEIKLPELELLIEKAEESEQYLRDVIQMYAEQVADHWDVALQYKDRIMGVCDKWSEGDDLAKGIKHTTGAYFNYYTTKFKETAEHAKKAIAIFEKISETELIGVVSMIYGSSLRSLGEFDGAVSLLTRATKNIPPDGQFGLYNAFGHYQLAEIFVQLGDLDLAKKNYLMALETAENGNFETAKFRTTNGLGNLYIALNDYDLATEYLEKALEISTSPSQVSRAKCDLGIFHTNTDRLDSAIQYLEESYSIRIESGFEDAATTSLIHLARALLLSGRDVEAEKRGLEGLEFAKRFNSKSKLSQLYGVLADVKEKQQDWKKTVEYFRLHEELSDELHRQQMRNIYKNKNRMIEEQKELIEEAHKEITDSIAYAKRIQTAILPPRTQLDECLKNHFVLYKPKDVVAGDFYWLESNDEHLLFAAADCTGHGVPGAMVSVVCHNALNRAVREFGLRLPGEILDKTKVIVVEEFMKAEEDVKDGMDICLCSLERNKLYFSGANNNLWLIRNNEIIEYKGDKQPVGKYALDNRFTTHEIDLKKGDSFYIFTDGYVDQFGGEKGKKFKPKNLKNLILSIQDKPIKEQELLLDEAFENWKGQLEQVDDVCVIGVRI
jgi:serine phosphatase RsbU (regulator of sigma subunit)/Flp pilus assembly protein TadD